MNSLEYRRPPIKETQVLCRALDGILKEVFPEELAIRIYRLTVALESKGFYVKDFGTHLKCLEDLDALPLDRFNHFIHRMNVHECFMCGQWTYMDGDGSYYGKDNRDAFSRPSENAYLYTGDCDYAFRSEDGAPFMIFTIPEPYTVVAFCWWGVRLVYLPGKEAMGYARTCVPCDKLITSDLVYTDHPVLIPYSKYE